jgi:hypothetical protein
LISVNQLLNAICDQYQLGNVEADFFRVKAEQIGGMREMEVICPVGQSGSIDQRV